ncbi:AAA family ATPase [Corallococcus sp. M34]|uniref:AAA family ATPase n=1 Tax=Citreicoccus inhibens TaxID=2849499 RepID=UPI001C228CC0|nr:AAA family ATPase [Citreicoccus inhibens]MBU8898333.1 AAA family ATPase [Citreicoccus inhibens]
MIVRRLRVQHFRCFRNPVELAGLGVGVHVVHGPNEMGKSSLVLALARALFDKYSTKDREVQNLRPWGTELSPRVTVEFEAEGKRYRLEKGFLDGASSCLDEWTGARFERLADSQAADEQVRKFLLASGATVGATKLGHWGLARLLWLNQSPERYELPTLDSSLKSRLMEAVGVVATSEPEQRLLAAVDAAYHQFYTLKARKPVADSALEKAAAEVASLEAQARALQARQEAAARHARAIEDAGDARTRLAKERDALEAQGAQLHERVAQEAKLEQQLALWDKDVERQRQECAALSRTQEDWLALKADVARHEAIAAAKEPELGQAREAWGKAEAACRAARESCRDAVDAQEACEQREARGRLLAKARQALAEQQRLEGLLIQAERLEGVVETLRRKAATSKSVSEADVRRVEDAERQQRQAQDRLEAQGIEVLFVPKGSQRIEWETQGHAQHHTVAKGEQKRFAGVSAASLRIEGVGEVRVRTGAEEIGKLQAEVEKHRKEVSRRLREHDASTLEELRARWESRQALLQEQEKHTGALTALLEAADVESVEVLRAQQRALAGQVGALAGQLDLGVESLRTYVYPEPTALAEELKARKQEARVRAKVKDEAEASARQAEGRLQALTQARDGARQTARALMVRLEAQLEVAGMSLAQCSARLNQAGERLARLENGRKELLSQLPRPEARAATQHRHVQETLARVQRAETLERERIVREEALLGQAAEDGVYSQWAELEERLAMATEVHARLKTRAEAAERLRMVVRHWLEQVDRTFVAPIQEAVRARLAYLRPSVRAEPFVLEAGLSGASMQTLGGDRALGSFSWGMQEQTLFALRLALGEVLARQGRRAEPQLVVLDDALVNTDAGRHQRALELIEAAGESLQVLILTAFPERYRSLRGSKEFDLRALVEASEST